MNFTRKQRQRMRLALQTREAEERARLGRGDRCFRPRDLVLNRPIFNGSLEGVGYIGPYLTHGSCHLYFPTAHFSPMEAVHCLSQIRDNDLGKYANWTDTERTVRINYRGEGRQVSFNSDGYVRLLPK